MQSNRLPLGLTVDPEGDKLHDRIVKVVSEQEKRLTSLLKPEEIDSSLDMFRRVSQAIQWMDKTA